MAAPHYSNALPLCRDALAAATMLNRTLVLPTSWCWCEYDWTPDVLESCKIKWVARRCVGHVQVKGSCIPHFCGIPWGLIASQGWINTSSTHLAPPVLQGHRHAASV